MGDLNRYDLTDEYRELTGKYTMVSDDMIEPHYTIEYVDWLENRIRQHVYESKQTRMQIRTYKQAEKLRKEIGVIETEMERIMDIEDRDNDYKFNELKLNAYGALNDLRNMKEREFEALNDTL